MGHADAIRAAREASGRDLADVAAALGMSFEAYRDVEDYDDEITSVVSFRDVVRLGELLALDLRRLFGADEAVLTFDELAAALRARETSVEQLEEEVGWELEAMLVDPRAFAGYPIDALADITAAVALDWRRLLPR